MFQLPACRALAGLAAPLPGSLRARLVTPAPLQLDPRPEYVRWGHSSKQTRRCYDYDLQ